MIHILMGYLNIKGYSHLKIVIRGIRDIMNLF